jgi:hypothetical protein
LHNPTFNAGIGAVNMSMASTAQPIDISGALKWNPAISVFEGRTISAQVWQRKFLQLFQLPMVQ